MGGRVKPGIELRISCSDIMLNYRLSQKLKLLGNGEFNYLTISLTAKSSLGSKNKKNWKGKDKPTCSHYSLNNHTVDKCYKVHGYPPGYKQRGRGSSSVNQVSLQDDQSDKHS